MIANSEQQTFIGTGALKTLPEYLRTRYGAGATVLLMHGRSSYFASGAHEVLSDVDDINWVHFDGVVSNPELPAITQALDVYRACTPSAVVAIGGGSVIDTTKAMLALSGGNSPEQIISGSFSLPDDRAELIAVPTTAGSGSEATHFAVLYKDRVKYSLAHPGLLPAAVWLDATLLQSCPRAVALSSGADAICQCVESWWNRNATTDSRELSRKGLARLIPAYFDPSGEEMLVGANLAGQAINITKTTAGHALSYGLTVSVGLPHGIAVLIVMQFLVEIMDRKIGFFSEETDLDRLFSAWGTRFPEAFTKFCEAVWCEHPITDYFKNVNKNSVLQLADTVNAERLGNHPVMLSSAQIYSIYQSIYDMVSSKK